MPFNRTLLTEPVHLNYDQHGAGTPLVLLHGYPFDHTIWKAQVRDLKENARLVTPDLRGHGKSPAPEGAYSLDLMAKDVFALLDQIGVFKAIWVGHSMGGYVTLAAYRLEPERFSGIGFIASNYLADSPEAKNKRYEAAEKVAQQGAEAALNPKAFKEGTPESSENVQKAKQLTLATSPAGIIGTLQAMAARPDSTETLRSIKVPALVVGGSGDQFFKPEIPQKMAELIPNAKLVMADAGHMPMLEQPGVVTDALRDLLARVEGA
jgi:3-oxoadipate enol-lactonase